MSAVKRLAPLALLLLAGPAIGQARHDSSAPIDFNAGLIEMQDKANRAILSGGVTVTQGNMTLTANRMTIAYVGQVTAGTPEATRVDAVGGVTVTRPNERAKAQYAVYDINKRLITLIGAVTLVRGQDVANGERLTINLRQSSATFGGGGRTVTAPDGTVTTKGGRVSGRFTAPKRDDD